MEVKSLYKGFQTLQAFILKGLVWLNGRLSLLSTKLVRWTGKCNQSIHPKHLIALPHHHWYMEYMQYGDRILDIGCGAGAHLLFVAQRVISAVGIDYNWQILRAARQLQRDDDISNVLFLVASAETTLPFRNASFDKVLVLDVIEHLNHRVELLREVKRILRPDGLLLLSAPNRENSWKQRLKSAGLPYYADPDHKIEYTLPELLAELSAAGFKVVGEPLPTVVETPLAGFIDVIGGLNLSLYRRLSQWKIKKVLHNPKETTGWRVVCCGTE
jgi:SAM-dependent methyltransferase